MLGDKHVVVLNPRLDDTSSNAQAEIVVFLDGAGEGDIQIVGVARLKGGDIGEIVEEKIKKGG